MFLVVVFVKVVFVKIDIDSSTDRWGLVQADLEADWLERRGRDVDRQVAHLLPARTVLVVVAAAGVDRKRQHYIRVYASAYRQLLRFARARERHGVGAGPAHRF